MCEMKNTLEMINRRLDAVEEKINECEFIPIKTTKGNRVKKRFGKIKRILVNCRTIPSVLTYV